MQNMPTVELNLEMHSEEISQKRLNSIRGIDNHERLDEELYQDFETDDARKVHLNYSLLQAFVDICKGK